MMLSANIHTWIKMDCMNRPRSSPTPIPSRVVSRFANISAEISVVPWIRPDALEITLCDTSNTAITILKVLEQDQNCNRRFEHPLVDVRHIDLVHIDFFSKSI